MHHPEGTYLGPIVWHLARRSNRAPFPHIVDSPDPPRAISGHSALRTEPHLDECEIPNLGEFLHSPPIFGT